MPAAHLPPDEAERLRSLHALSVLDTPNEPVFDALVQAAALTCGAPISLVSLVDEDRQWFKANTGLPGAIETPRDVAFCAHAILQDGVFEVPDARNDPRFADNPLVTGAPDIRFYAGAPLTLSDGSRAGTLCVIDRQPRQLTAQQRETLHHLATAAVHALESRRALHAERGLREAQASALGALADAERRFRELYETTPAMMHSIDPQRRLISVSHNWLDTLGYRQDEVLGRQSTDFMTESARAQALAVLPKFFDEGRVNDLPLQMVCKNGQVLEVLMSAVLVRDAQGQPLRGLAVLQNLTELRAAQQTAEALLHAIDDRFISSITDSAGTITHVNQAFCAISGYQHGELIGADHRIVNSGVMPAGFFADMWATIRTGASWRGDVCNRAKDGSLYWVDSVVAPLPAVAGRPAGYVSVRSNITQRKAQEERLRRSEQLLNRTGELAGVGGWELDLPSGRLFWSDQTCRIHGLAPGHQPALAEAINFYAPEARPVIQAAVETAMGNGQGWDLELPFIQADGTPIWVRTVGQAEFDQGQPVRLTGAFQDITERYYAAAALALKTEELQRSNGDLERFAYVASHDLQEPLRMVTAYGQLLLRRHHSSLPPDAQEFVGYMIDGGARAQALIRDLLSLARLDSQAKPWVPVNLEATLAEVLQPLRLRLQETGAQVTHDALPTVLGDPGQLGQLLAYLLGNALKFCGDAAPRVHLSAQREARRWRISVTDQGIGIEARYFDRIFQMFQRLHLRSDYEGTGIGLAICKKVVERHGGQIGVVSTPGQGTTFFFTLPQHEHSSTPGVTAVSEAH